MSLCLIAIKFYYRFFFYFSLFPCILYFNIYVKSVFELRESYFSVKQNSLQNTRWRIGRLLSYFWYDSVRDLFFHWDCQEWGLNFNDDLLFFDNYLTFIVFYIKHSQNCFNRLFWSRLFRFKITLQQRKLFWNWGMTTGGGVPHLNTFYIDICVQTFFAITSQLPSKSNNQLISTKVLKKYFITYYLFSFIRIREKGFIFIVRH